jgi:hypothetical protein
MALYRDTIRINPSDRERLRRAGLDTTDRVLKHLGDQVVAWSKSTETVRVDLPAGDGGLYVKRYHHLRWKHRIKAMFRGTFFGRSRARTEYDRLIEMSEQGAPVVRAVACGERRTFRFLRSCFLVTEAVPSAISLASFAQKAHAESLLVAEQHRFAKAIGRCVGEMHGRGIVHGALRWRNVLVRRDGDGGYAFTFLDAPTRKRGPSKRFSARGDLADLAAAALECCTRTEMMRFFRSYLNKPRLSPADKAMARNILASAQPLRAHEAYRLKMNRIFHYHLVPER